MRILYWGTPDFAVPSLRALLDEGHEIIGVVTQPDRRAGRGRELQSPPVKDAAEAEGVAVLQPRRARDEAFIERVEALEPELSVVVAYGQILTRRALDAPEHGSINVHASLLPELRGAAPINWAIIRGHERTGITIMRMVEELDAGPILYQVDEPILPDERASDLWARLSELAAESIVEALALFDAGELTETEQDHERATYAPRLTREDARIDWDEDAETVARWVRGLDEFPGGWTKLEGRTVKVFRPRPEPDRAHDAEPGTVLKANPNRVDDGVLVACGAGAVWIREVTPEGRRRMTSASWIRGRGVDVGDRFV
ncbi:MAG: methionyl-tRNA formyltransferase [Gemmatimonadota bacterium]